MCGGGENPAGRRCSTTANVLLVAVPLALTSDSVLRKSYASPSSTARWYPVESVMSLPSSMQPVSRSSGHRSGTDARICRAVS